MTCAYTTSVLLLRDKEDNNFFHLFMPGEIKNHYLCTLHIDALYDLFGNYNQQEIINVIGIGKFNPFTLELRLKS